jgi:hypothetical protein
MPFIVRVKRPARPLYLAALLSARRVELTPHRDLARRYTIPFLAHAAASATADLLAVPQSQVDVVPLHTPRYDPDPPAAPIPSPDFRWLLRPPVTGASPDFPCPLRRPVTGPSRAFPSLLRHPLAEASRAPPHGVAPAPVVASPSRQPVCPTRPRRKSRPRRGRCDITDVMSPCPGWAAAAGSGCGPPLGACAGWRAARIPTPPPRPLVWAQRHNMCYAKPPMGGAGGGRVGYTTRRAFCASVHPSWLPPWRAGPG